MSFVEPMLASPMPTKGPKPWDEKDWWVEEKFDGHRIIVNVDVDGSVRAWARNRERGVTGIPRVLPPHLVKALSAFSVGTTLDGELFVPGSRSYGVKELTNVDKLVYVVFDLVCVMGASITGNGSTPTPYTDRREMLNTVFSDRRVAAAAMNRVLLAESQPVTSEVAVKALCNRVWHRGGEGLILKRGSGLYVPGKRTKDWVKMKALCTAVLTVIGYVAGKLGPQATVMLKDDEGNTTTVKTLNNAELSRLAKDPQAFISRRLRIEYQERTPDGSYRHPRWDRWEDE